MKRDLFKKILFLCFLLFLGTKTVNANQDTIFIIINPNICNSKLLKASYIASISSRADKKLFIYFKETRRRALQATFEQYFQETLPVSIFLEVYNQNIQSRFNCQRSICIYDSEIPDKSFHDFEEYFFNPEIFIQSVATISDTILLNESGVNLGRPNFSYTPEGGYLAIGNEGSFVLYDHAIKVKSSGNYLDSLIHRLRSEFADMNPSLDLINLKRENLFKPRFSLLRSNDSSAIVLGSFDLVKTASIEAAPLNYIINLLFTIDLTSGFIRGVNPVEGATSDLFFKIFNAFYVFSDSSLVSIPVNKNQPDEDLIQKPMQTLARLNKDKNGIFRFNRMYENYLAPVYDNLPYIHGMLIFQYFEYKGSIYAIDVMQFQIHKVDDPNYFWDVAPQLKINANKYEDLYETGYFKVFISAKEESDNDIQLIISEFDSENSNVLHRKIIKLNPEHQKVVNKRNLPDINQSSEMKLINSKLKHNVLHTICINNQEDTLHLVTEKIVD